MDALYEQLRNAPHNASPTAALVEVLRERGLLQARLGVEMEGVTPPSLQELQQSLPHASLKDCSNLIRLIRAVKSPEEIERHADGHDLTVMLEFDSINRPAFYLPADGIVHRIEKIDHRSGSTATRRFVCVNGVVAPSPALLGGTETVNFEMLLREVVGDDTVGFEIPFSGSFSATID